MSLWIAFTLAAALAQTARFALQKRLGGTGLSPTGATFARFLFAAPLAALAALVVFRAGDAIFPPLPPAFWGFVIMGGIAQIVATDLTVRLFALRNFAVGVAFTKTETLLVALFSLILLGETISATGLLVIAIGFAGVLLLSRRPDPGTALASRPVLLGLLAGALFGVASVGYRGATLALEPAPFLLRATVALAAATAIQTLLMAVWLRVRQPGEIARVTTGWRSVFSAFSARSAGSSPSRFRTRPMSARPARSRSSLPSQHPS